MKQFEILPGMIIHTISGNEFVVTKKPLNIDAEVKTFKGELITKITYGRETVYKRNPREIIIRGDFTTLEIEETEKGYFITAYGDGRARMEISKKTFEMICKDYDYGVEEK